MPTLGKAEDNNLTVVRGPGVTQIPDLHRAKERERMNIPDEPEPIIALSDQQRVYIYNVSCWSFKQEMGSMGAFFIPALDEGKVLDGGLHVAGPLTIAGLPKEYYPSEGQARVLYHQPPKNRGRQSARPGYDFAIEIVGGGMMSQKGSDLRNSGVFISEQLEPEKPDMRGLDAKRANEIMVPWKKWEADVREAQKRLRERCAKLCEDANVEYARGNFKDVRNDQLYQAARLIKKTELECPWMKDTAEQSDKKACIACGTVMRGSALKCPSCGEQQVSDDVFQSEIKRRRETTL